MEIRRIRPEEYEALAEITVRAYREVNETDSLGPYEQELRDVAAHDLDAEVYVALDDQGGLMGGVTLVRGPASKLAEFDDPDAGGIRMLAIDPAVQGRGAGRALLRACIERARELGRARLILHSAPAMTLAQAMYLRAGFVRVRALDEFIREDPTNSAPALHLKAFALTL